MTFKQKMLILNIKLQAQINCRSELNCTLIQTIY